MRINRPIDALFPRIRQGILAAVLLHPERWWYGSDLARHLDVTPSSLQRELRSLVAAGILERRQDGNRVYVRAHPACPFLPDLQRLLIKTAGIVDVLREALTPFASRLTAAWIFGSVARGREIADSDVDLLVVGTVGLAELAPALRAAEGKLGRPVNPTLYPPEEFARKREDGHPFITQVLAGPLLPIFDDNLAAASRGIARPDAPGKQARTRRPARGRRTGPA
jgi:predicted nucleotidyltransferase